MLLPRLPTCCLYDAENDGLATPGQGNELSVAVEVGSVTVAIGSANLRFDREHERVFEAVVVFRRFMFHCYWNW